MIDRVISEISALAYIGIQSRKANDWETFATSILGMQSIDRGGKIQSLRMDDRAQRLIVDAEKEGSGFYGWEVVYHAQLDQIAARLESAGHTVHQGTASLIQQRMVSDLIWFHDPSGYRLEVCWNPVIADTAFVPSRPIEGFVTGPLGMGHIVLHTDKFDEMLDFYCGILRFNISDYISKPIPIYFFHVNDRHHSFAMAGSGRVGVHHFMVEMMSLDDVGQGYDLLCQEEEQVAYTIGRHTNDWVTSFYSHTPSDFFVEYGWGGRRVDPATWEPVELLHGPSLWGHERLYMDDAGRKNLRDMRLNAAAQGERAGNIPSCAWASSLIAKSK